jgi:hypothetical protein
VSRRPSVVVEAESVSRFIGKLGPGCRKKMIDDDVCDDDDDDDVVPFALPKTTTTSSVPASNE